MYRYVDAVLVRAVAETNGEAPKLPCDALSCGEGDCQTWRGWIADVWAVEAWAEAVEIASPSLAGQISALCAGAVYSTKQIRRMAYALARYVLRATHRPTPFGLFAGVAPAQFGLELQLRWGKEHLPVARVDAAWLSDVINHLESYSALLRRLPVVVDATHFVRGERLVLPCQRPTKGDGAPRETSVRHTTVVAEVVAAASSPVVMGELAEQLTSDYPNRPTEAIETLLAELVAHHVLLTSLHPPMSVTDPLEHVLEQLDTADAATLVEVAPTVAALRDIHTILHQHTNAAPAERRSLRDKARRRMTALSRGSEQPVTVDLRLDCDLSLPRDVAREAEKAATALTRLTPNPSGSAVWQEYHTQFLERYGVGAVVPVRQLVEPDAGLGFPAGYRGSLRARPQTGLTTRDETLLMRAQAAACEGAREIVLTDSCVAELQVAEIESRPPHLDLCFQLWALTQEALGRGDFTLAVTGVAPAAGASVGRFLHLLDTDIRKRLTATYTALPTVDHDALVAQVSSPPLRLDAENVSRTPRIWPELISLAEHSPHQTISLDDIAVGVDAERMYLTSIATGRRVEPAIANAVELVNFTHPLARFLYDLPRGRAARVGLFSWGAARRLPFLPRVRYGRTVLASATWRIAASQLPGPSATRREWESSVASWRDRFRVPATVEVGDDDRRIRLDLDSEEGSALLRAEIRRTVDVTLREAPEKGAYGWFDGRAHEITVAVASTRAPQRPPTRLRPAGPVVLGRDHGHVPGASRWLLVKLYGHPERVPELLAGPVTTLFSQWPNPPTWWFVRYRDPDDHLRIRLRLSRRDAAGEAVERIGSWVRGLRVHGLVGRVHWDTYYPETGRYGSGATMAAAETVFAADSAACVAQLALTTNGDRHRWAITAASLVDLAVSFTDNADVGLRWLIDHTAQLSSGRLPRAAYDEAMRLSTPHDEFATLRELPGCEALTTAWAARRTELHHYRALLIAGGEVEPDAVLASLMHMHHVRAIGLDTDSERACYRLARAAALSWSARHQGVTR